MKVSDLDSAEKIERRNMLRKKICLSAGAVAYDPNKSMLGSTTQELLEDRRRCMKAGQGIFDKVKREKRDDMDENETEIWNEAMEVADRISEELDNRRASGTFEDTESPLNRIFPAGPIRGGRGGRGGANAPEMWRNVQTGEMVPVIGREHRVADYIRPQHDPEQRDLSLGGVMRAMMLPETRSPTEIRALAEGSDGAGGYTVPVYLLPRFVDLMREKSVMFRAGMRTVPLTTEKTDIAKVLTHPGPTWKSEAEAMTEGNMTFGRVRFTARTLRVIVKASQEILQDSINVEEALRNALAQAFALEFDRVSMFGTGTPPEPGGLINQSIQTIDNNGAGIGSYDLLLDAYQKLLDANSAPPTAAIMAPRTLIKFSKLKDTTNQPMQRPPLIANLPMLETSAVPVNLGPGSPNNLSRILTGDFTQALLGLRMNMTIQVLKERYADTYEIGFLAAMRGDFQVAQANSFVDVQEIP